METTKKTKTVLQKSMQPEVESTEKLLDESFYKPAKKKYLKFGVVALAAVGILYMGGYRIMQGVFPWASDDVRAEAELTRAVETVGKLMVLPKGEPVLATVTNAAEIRKQQPFFQNVIDGDQLLIFAESAQAVIYSPSRDKIINVGPIQYSQNTEPAKTSPSAQAAPAADTQTLVQVTETTSVISASQDVGESVSVEVRNGSGVNGAGASTANTLEAISGVKVSAVADAASTDYQDTVVVLLNDSDQTKTTASLIADTLNSSVVTTLPTDEVSSSADVVVILGTSN